LSGTPVTLFAQPYTLILDYTPAELAARAVKEAGLNLLYWNGSTWVDMLPCTGCSVDTGSNCLMVVANHLTEFAFVGKTERIFLPLVVK
jgi:hypothetical protein